MIDSRGQVAIPAPFCCRITLISVRLRIEVSFIPYADATPSHRDFLLFPT